MSKDDRLLMAAQSETSCELAADIAAAIVLARKRHGDDPEFDLLVVAAIGTALDRLRMRDHVAVGVLGVALAEHYEDATGKSLRRRRGPAA